MHCLQVLLCWQMVSGTAWLSRTHKKVHVYDNSECLLLHANNSPLGTDLSLHFGILRRVHSLSWIKSQQVRHPYLVWVFLKEGPREHISICPIKGIFIIYYLGEVENVVYVHYIYFADIYRMGINNSSHFFSKVLAIFFQKYSPL